MLHLKAFDSPEVSGMNEQFHIGQWHQVLF